jgi:hypothetical protein
MKNGKKKIIAGVSAIVISGILVSAGCILSTNNKKNNEETVSAQNTTTEITEDVMAEVTTEEIAEITTTEETTQVLVAEADLPESVISGGKTNEDGSRVELVTVEVPNTSDAGSTGSTEATQKATGSVATTEAVNNSTTGNAGSTEATKKSTSTTEATQKTTGSAATTEASNKTISTTEAQHKTTTEAPKKTTEAPKETTEASKKCSHKWVEQYKTVHHDAVTHVETVIDSYAYDEPVYESHPICNGCGMDFYAAGYSIDDIMDHLEVHDAQGEYYSYGSKKVIVGYIPHEEVSHEETVVDEEAWDEEVLTGYKCSKCGATK